MSNLMDFLKSSIETEETTQKVEDECIVENDIEEKEDGNENIPENSENIEIEKENKEVDLFSALGVEAPKISAKVIFKYGDREEEIKDLNITFEGLRKSKVEDFLELEDKDKVIWNVNYLIFKTVRNPEKKSVSEVKSEIEEDKEFKRALSKNKKTLMMEIKPSIRAKTKG